MTDHAPAAGGSPNWGQSLKNVFFNFRGPRESFRTLRNWLIIGVVLLVGSCVAQTTTGISSAATTSCLAGYTPHFQEAGANHGWWCLVRVNGEVVGYQPTTTSSYRSGNAGEQAAEFLNNGADAIRGGFNAGLDATVNNPVLWGAAANLFEAVAPLLLIAGIILLFRGRKSGGSKPH